MKKIQVLGPGCAKCSQTAEMITAAALKQKVEVEVTKVTDLKVMLSFGILSTPAVVVEGTLVHSGSVPKLEQILDWLKPYPLRRPLVRLRPC
ncbi:MAG: hypothetical protein A2600_05370 [Candidatus Lambdaproteobacteria bacterium RIFOXYD1_FULL_56_27]|uniref:Thioredoxin-like fold domain-containing protein n=1 Tax=Candidatus Lambdaproteobacteria bacterium RIFOXYD2_FULL_56_26 TaxID=1817773 RepID=A0A1F6GX28_9PROT|nr:MAG: hypothetical protein A2426_10580 [Candidatus Lambdaproteobacteria bacterium RIFOXYC1_FULL_56_13]OGH02727.1 MAG: hypothetical protein A2557_06265 [Candidatus Lambdaproteobacteria bacterium RIFOXYD2_FULL_56_26]OGH07797.1 MAG: hypothetical protein A2600_05370 [Candidatus Lambdaproteobacteria bacterium RIFOXYD1_FULL_56_27]